MAQTTSVKSIFSQKSSSGEPYEPISRLAGFGGIIGLIAGIVGLLSNTPLIPLPSMDLATLSDYGFISLSAFFLLMLSFGVLIQMLESKDLRDRLGSGLANTGFLAGIIGFLLLAYLFAGGIDVNMSANPDLVALTDLEIEYLTLTALLSTVFLVLWQLWSVIYVDSSNSVYGMLAGIFNGFALPVMAVGMAFPIMLPISYIMLIIGQLMVVLFWWSPKTSIREFSTSPGTAKLAFGIGGVATFLIGAFAITSSFSVVEQVVPVSADVPVWIPFVSGIVDLPIIAPLIWGFCGSMIFWVMLSPRLNKIEMKAVNLRNDLVHGGLKYMMVFFAALGVLAAGQAGTFILNDDIDVIETYALFLTWAPTGVMFVMGALYMSKNDIITGLPLLLTSVFMLGYPYVMSSFILIPFILVLVTQALLIFETKVRGFMFYQTPILSVIVTIAFSGFFIAIMLGALGSAPAAIWPTNLWFNITLFPDIDKYIQASTVMIFPLLALLVRNVALSGFTRGKAGDETTSDSAGVLIGMSILFALMIPLIGSAWKGVTHQALTAAAIMFALYAISFVLVLSVNLNLAGEVEDTGNPIEGMLLRLTSIAGIVVGSIIAVIVLGTFSGFPTPIEVANTITLLVILIASLEILALIGWLSAGIRLGLLRSGFKFVSYKDSVAAAELLPPPE